MKDEVSVEDIFNAKKVTKSEFQFDRIYAPPVLGNFIDFKGLCDLKSVILGAKYGGNIMGKQLAIREIMSRYGFYRLGSGTNRVIYGTYADDRFIIKMALDRAGIKANEEEFYRTQYLLKPFCPKLFELFPKGIGLVEERVRPIKNKKEFNSVATDVFSLIYTLVGRFVVDDIGSKYFMNYGFREDFGPVLLDFPNVYELDGNKLVCNAVIDGITCGGAIDYDIGFNQLRCTRCGKVFTARSLSKDVIEKLVLVKGGKPKMEIMFTMAGNVENIENENAREALKNAKNRKPNYKNNERKNTFKRNDRTNRRFDNSGKNDEKEDQNNKRYGRAEYFQKKKNVNEVPDVKVEHITPDTETNNTVPDFLDDMADYVENHVPEKTETAEEEIQAELNLEEEKPQEQPKQEEQSNVIEVAQFNDLVKKTLTEASARIFRNKEYAQELITVYSPEESLMENNKNIINYLLGVYMAGLVMGAEDANVKVKFTDGELVSPSEISIKKVIYPAIEMIVAFVYAHVHPTMKDMDEDQWVRYEKQLTDGKVNLIWDFSEVIMAETMEAPKAENKDSEKPKVVEVGNEDTSSF